MVKSRSRFSLKIGDFCTVLLERKNREEGGVFKKQQYFVKKRGAKLGAKLGIFRTLQNRVTNTITTECAFADV